MSEEFARRRNRADRTARLSTGAVRMTTRRSPRSGRRSWCRGRGGGGPAPMRIVVAYGFWIFLLSDIIMFSALFATYAVLSGQTAGGPSGHELFELRHVGIETVCLLFSSYTCGLGALSAERQRRRRFLCLRRAHVRARRDFSLPRVSRIRRHGAQGRRAVAQRLSLGLLHPRRPARRARDQRPAVADVHGGADRREGPAARACGGGCCASACSGTRSTSSGWAC